MMKKQVVSLVLICVCLSSCQINHDGESPDFSIKSTPEINTYTDSTSSDRYEQFSYDNSDKKKSTLSSENTSSEMRESSSSFSSEAVSQESTNDVTPFDEKTDWAIYENGIQLFFINQFVSLENNGDFLFLDVIPYKRDKDNNEFTSNVYMYNDLAIYVSDFDYSIDGKTTNERHITSLKWRNNNNIKTHRGITIGSSTKEVQNAYGNAVINRSEFNGTSAESLDYGYVPNSEYSRNIEFRIQNGKVVQIFLYEEPEDVFENYIAIYPHSDYWKH